MICALPDAILEETSTVKPDFQPSCHGTKHAISMLGIWQQTSPFMKGTHRIGLGLPHYHREFSIWSSSSYACLSKINQQETY